MVAAALDEQARRQLRRYRRKAWGWLALGIVLLLAVAIGAVVVDDRETRLERDGARVPGVVAEVGKLGEGGRIVVAFEWDGRSRRTSIRLDAESPAYTKGQQTTVLVDRQDPDHVSIPGETNQSALTVWPMITALVLGCTLLVGGPWCLARARRQRRLLRRTSWRRLPCRYREIPSGRSIRSLLIVDEADGSRSLLTLASAGRWRLRPSGLRETHEVDVAGDSSRYVVVRVPGRDLVLSARRPWTRRAARRWRRIMEGETP